MKNLFFLLGVLFVLGARGQLHVDQGATVFLDSGAVISVQGGVEGWIQAGTVNLTLSGGVFPVNYHPVYLGRPGETVIRAGGDIRAGLRPSGAAAEGSIQVWPNPTSGGFFIDAHGKCQLELYNAEGKLIKRKEIDAVAPVYFELDSWMAKGVYLLRVMRTGTVEATKSVFLR